MLLKVVFFFNVKKLNLRIRSRIRYVRQIIDKKKKLFVITFWSIRQCYGDVSCAVITETFLCNALSTY